MLLTEERARELAEPVVASETRAQGAAVVVESVVELSDFWVFRLNSAR